jgi:hypothetical protein
MSSDVFNSQQKKTMKKYLFTALVLLSGACRQEEIEKYDPADSMIEFRTPRTDYSFRAVAGQNEQTVEIPLDIVGWPSAVERRAEFAIVGDSTTAAAGQYEIIDAVVPAESFTGTLRVKVKNDRGGDFEDVRIYLRAVAGGDFAVGAEEYRDHALYLTNKLLRPAEWLPSGSLTNLLGTYSTAYYAFIIETTGETRFPVFRGIPDYPNTDPWGYWSTGYVSAFVNNLKEVLREYNRNNPPLLHDDGPAAGYPVVVGKTVYP